MILRAQISRIEDKYHYKVRIPQFNKAREAVGATPESELYTATVSVDAGLSPELSTGDTVLVAFENGDESSPTIIGLLFNSKAQKIRSDAAFTSLDVSVNAKFSEDVTIGKVTKDNIKHLVDLDVNIKEKFNLIDEAIKANKSRIDKLVTITDSLRKDVDLNTRNIQALNTTLNNHTGDRTVHITAEERAKWDSKADGNHTHTKADITDLDLGTIILSSSSYGTSKPTSTDAQEGQLYFKINE